jgi:hypothetical protein
VPSTHKPGKTEAPSDRLDADPLSHIVVLSMDTTLRANRTAFLTDLNGALPGGKNELLIFIHGYNCTLKGAAMRAGQFKVDLKFEGQVMAYSWASRGDWRGYRDDEKTVQMTVGHLEELLKTLMKEVSLTCLNGFITAGYTAVSSERRYMHPQDLVIASNLHLRQTKLASTFSWLFKLDFVDVNFLAYGRMSLDQTTIEPMLVWMRNRRSCRFWALKQAIGSAFILVWVPLSCT